MLEAVQDATEAEGWMPPTPIWHAPILATALAGFALVNDGPDGWAVAGVLVGGLAALFAIVDQARRRRVTPRRMTRPARVVAFYGFILVVSGAIVIAWGALELSDSSGRAAVMLVAAWLATTAAFAVGISITDRMRARWTALQA